MPKVLLIRTFADPGIEREELQSILSGDVLPRLERLLEIIFRRPILINEATVVKDGEFAHPKYRFVVEEEAGVDGYFMAMLRNTLFIIRHEYPELKMDEDFIFR